MATQNEELLKEIAYLKRLNKELSEHIFYDDVTQFPWLGNLGHWFWDVAQNVVTFNPLKCEAIGYKRQELPDQIGFEFFTEKLHPEDYQRTMDAMLAHMKGESPVWEVKYRIKAKDGSWKVFYDRGKITNKMPMVRHFFCQALSLTLLKLKLNVRKSLKEPVTGNMSHGTIVLPISIQGRNLKDSLPF